MMPATVIAGRRVAVAPARVANRCRVSASRRMVVRALAEDPNTASTSSSVEVEGPSGSLTILGNMQEAINGRAAMLGFVAAVASEASTHQAVWSQIAGKYSEVGELLEKPLGTSTLLFGATVALITMATLMPKLLDNEEPGKRSFGPFTPGLETTLGRAAQLGFAGLVLIELVKGSALLG